MSEFTTSESKTVDMTQVITATPYRVFLYWPGCPDEDYADIAVLFVRDEAQLDAFLAAFVPAAGYEKSVKDAFDAPLEGPAEALYPRIVFDEDSPVKASGDAVCRLADETFKDVYFSSLRGANA